MNYCDVEKKWQKKWADTGLYKFDENSDKPKHYVLEMFSYPSGANLHIGHWYNYSLSDTYARFMRMKGFNVFHPMGFDAFGLPAENYAIKTGVHPQDSTRSNIATMEKQLAEIGATYDWDYELKTCEPEYYKWTQWCFLQLYKNGLAYRKNAPVNWCPSCNTVLANEQVIDGECERCGSTVVRKNLTQWFFRITDYADRLLEGLDKIDWPEKTKTMQKNWIGKSKGGEIEFKVDGTGQPFTVFTTRADTLFGCTYVVISPEHPLLDSLTTPEQKAAVEAYKEYASKASEIDRLSTTRDKTGVFTGSYAINPINGREVPIWTADYVLASYGTGIVMAVPAHDERDFDFATKYGLPIERVIKAEDGDDTLPFTDPGVLVNSVEFDGLSTAQGKEKIIERLKLDGRGDFKVNYRLRDWLISRQRYWGAPIPIIHCPNCGEVPVPETQLPVELPYDVNFSPDGTSPLAKADAFVNVTCPKCGSQAKRDPDTMDTFVCSSWYYLRYPDNKNNNAPFDCQKIDSFLPVDKYIGGAEHAVMHLLYARFFTKALHDMGYLDFEEPFISLVHQGTILGSDGEKMSKSRGNVVSPDELVHAYGSDTLRLYLAFGFNYVEGGPWNDNGVKGVNRFLERAARVVARAMELPEGSGEKDKDLSYAINYAIDQVSRDIPNFSFNTAVARIMELTNAIYKYLDKNPDGDYAREAVKTLLLLLAPFAPHFAEEQWEKMGQPYSIFNFPFPEADKSALIKDTMNMAFQINGKVKGSFDVSSGATNKEIEETVMREFEGLLKNKQVVKKIVIPGSIVNFVVQK